ncbi:MAG TPA: pitrilysin family protein [Kofleriaceae bacterium]|nr:pitrilysin family protein [Kofleriaceae bacterium]
MRRSRFVKHAVILAGVASAIPAPAAPDPPKIVGKLPAVDTFSLSNGLQVAVLRTDAAPVVSVQLWYHVGSKDEPRERRGTAHMFEHMMFEGSERVRPQLHAQSIEWLGGYVNAATDEDSTHFVDTLPAQHLDYVLQLEADRMRGLRLTRPAIDVGRATIQAELRQQDASPFAQGLLRTLGFAYQKHPYASMATGNAKELEGATADELKKFYDAYYQPNNALLVVVGKVTTADVKASVEKQFGAIPRGSDPPRPAATAAEPPQTAKRHQVVEPGAVGLTLVGWHIPAARDKDIYALQLALNVLGTGEGSRLKTRLKTPDPKTKQPLALDAGMDAFIREDPGMVIALGAYVDPAKADAVEAALTDEVSKLAARGPTGDELRKAKNQIQAGFVFSLETAQGLGEAIGRSWIFTGDPRTFLYEADELEKVSAADVQRVAKQYLSPDRATVVVIPPKAR